MNAITSIPARTEQAAEIAASWQHAMRQYAIATAAYQEMVARERAGDNIDRNEDDQVVAVQEKAHTALMTTPAPDNAALLWKLEYLFSGDGQGSVDPWSLDFCAQTIADFRRLLGGNAATTNAWQAACEAELAAKSAADQFYAEHVRPVSVAHEEGKASADEVTIQEDAVAPLYDAHYSTVAVMMTTRAPSAHAVLRKLRTGLRNGFFDGSDQGCAALEHIAGDLARLTGEA
ncbi:UNVERIFIED_ORG: hypothetical protein ABIC34_003871 [Sphingomonas sp. 1057]